jgi:hypothetical protein
MAYELLMQMQTEEQTETPTATSGLVQQPPGIRDVGSEDLTVRTRSPLEDDGDDDVTLLADLSGRQSAPGSHDRTMPAMRHRLAAQIAESSPRSAPSSRTVKSVEINDPSLKQAPPPRKPRQQPVSEDPNNGVQALIAVLVMAVVLGVWALIR